jgi:fructokinase
MFGGIEAGGTKFVCAVGSGPADLAAVERFATTAPGETIALAIEFFQRQEARHGRLEAVGIASFGPLDPRVGSPTWGYITSTPKPGWANTDLAGAVGRALRVSVGFDTDVNGAALAEWRWGAAQGLDCALYLTVGTGIGGGGVIAGRPMHGLVHPEMGHIRIPHDTHRDPYLGHCPFHGDCLEGLACGPAIAERWGAAAQDLPPDHPAWDLEAHYLALAVANFACTLSPERVILGGGVMEQPALLPLVRRGVQELLAGYIQSSAILHDIDRYIVAPGLGDLSGVLGALALAQRAVE